MKAVLSVLLALPLAAPSCQLKEPAPCVLSGPAVDSSGAVLPEDTAPRASPAPLRLARDRRARLVREGRTLLPPAVGWELLILGGPGRQPLPEARLSLWRSRPGLREAGFPSRHRPDAVLPADRDGKVAIPPALDSEDLFAVIQAEGFLPSLVELRPGGRRFLAASGLGEVVLRVRPPASHAILVADAKGRPVPGAEVLLRPLFLGSAAWARTGLSGQARLARPPGPLRLEVLAGGRHWIGGALLEGEALPAEVRMLLEPVAVAGGGGPSLPEGAWASLAVEAAPAGRWTSTEENEAGRLKGAGRFSFDGRCQGPGVRLQARLHPGGIPWAAGPWGKGLLPDLSFLASAEPPRRVSLDLDGLRRSPEVPRPRALGLARTGEGEVFWLPQDEGGAATAVLPPGTWDLVLAIGSGCLRRTAALSLDGEVPEGGSLWPSEPLRAVRGELRAGGRPQAGILLQARPARGFPAPAGWTARAVSDAAGNAVLYGWGEGDWLVAASTPWLERSLEHPPWILPARAREFRRDLPWEELRLRREEAGAGGGEGPWIVTFRTPAGWILDSIRLPPTGEFRLFLPRGSLRVAAQVPGLPGAEKTLVLDRSLALTVGREGPAFCWEVR